MGKNEAIELFTLKEIAGICKVSLTHAKSHLKQELGPPVRVGKRAIRWTRQQLDEFIEKSITEGYGKD